MSPSLKVKCLEPRVLKSWSLRFEHAIGYEAGGERLRRAPLRQCGESNGIIDFECLDRDQIRCTWCRVLVPLKASSVRLDKCGLTGEQDPDSDLGVWMDRGIPERFSIRWAKENMSLVPTILVFDFYREAKGGQSGGQ